MSSDGHTGTMHVIVTCSHRKKRPAPRALQLGQVRGTRLATRVRAWTARLADATVPTVPARDLYAGEHWDIARRLPDTSTSRVQLWVCSAGYGLIPAEAHIRPYSATFTATHPDSVPGGRTASTAWWTALSEWDGPEPAVRSLAQLAASDSTAQLLLILSAPYLSACRFDVLDAVGRLDAPSQLSIISAGTRPDSELANLLLPVDARLQHAVGGTRQSLNVRVAAHLLSGGHSTLSAMREQLAELLARQPPVRRYERDPMTDREVTDFVRTRLRSDPGAGHTRLLRELRQSGRACEQARFAALFRATTEETG